MEGKKPFHDWRENCLWSVVLCLQPVPLANLVGRFHVSGTVCNLEGECIQYEASAFLEYSYCMCEVAELKKQCFKQWPPETDSLREIVQGEITLNCEVTWEVI